MNMNNYYKYYLFLNKYLFIIINNHNRYYNYNNYSRIDNAHDITKPNEMTSHKITGYQYISSM